LINAVDKFVNHATDLRIDEALIENIKGDFVNIMKFFH